MSKQEARRLTEENIELAYKAANNMADRHNQWDIIDDLVQAASMGLFEAALTWDPDKGALSTHAWPRMAVAMNRYAQRTGAFRGFTLERDWFESTEFREAEPVPATRTIHVTPTDRLDYDSTWEPGWDGGIEDMLDQLEPEPAEWEEAYDRVMAVLDELKPKHREALLVWGTTGARNYTETARVLGLSSHDVAKNRVGAAMKILRAELPDLVTGEQAVLTRADDAKRKELHG